MKRELLHIDDKGRVELPEWAWRACLKMSGSKAKSASGMRKAIKKQFEKLLWEYLEKKK